MSLPEWKRVLPSLLCAALVALLGCAADGGSTGTGISAIVSGNVIRVDSAKNDLPVVRVSIDEVPDAETMTDDEGSFELAGEFAGALTLRFSALDFSVTQTVDIPAGSVIVLEDITVRRPMVGIGMARQLGFFGTVAVADCEAGELVVDDRGASPRQFLVHVSDDTSVIRVDGTAVPCTDIGVGTEIAVEGAIRLSDRTIDAATITLDPGRPGNPSALIEVSFRGTITLFNCESGMILIDARTGATRLRLSPRTPIMDLDHHPIECTDLEVGDQVEGRGIIRVRRPGVIDVNQMRVVPPSP